MPQPAAVDAIARELTSMFAEAQAEIERQLASFPSARRASKLRQLQRTVSTLLDQLEAETRAWIEGSLPEAYAFGAGDAAAIIGEGFVWTEPHIAALNALARTTWDDMLSATRLVRRDTKEWIRSEARQQSTLALLEGRTARQAGRALSDAAGNELDLFAVTYRNGARVRLGDYADMALRTVTANAYAEGTLNQSRASGVQFMECADGSDCGLSSHEDGEKPNGKVYPISVAGAYPLAHPRCRRSWIPRPDAKKANASSLRTPEQLADQRAFEERQRLEASNRRRRSSRQPRASREPRSTRRRATPMPSTPKTSPASRLRFPDKSIRPDQNHTINVAREAAEAVGGVHHVPETMREVEVRAAVNLDAEGQFGWTTAGRPSEIAINTRASRPDSTFAHEFGHYLDFEGIGTPGGFASIDDPLLEPWRQAVDQTAAVAKLKELGADPTVRAAAQRHINTYMLTREELWARSYAQWIAERSGNAKMLAQMDALRELELPYQWGTEDFGPIGDAIEELLRSLGLMP